MAEQNAEAAGSTEETVNDESTASEETSEESSSDDNKSAASEEGSETNSETSDDGEKSEEVDGAPDEYADFDVPEGFEVDDELKSSLHDLGKEHNLSQEAAQKFADLHAKGIEKLLAKQADDWAALKESWADEVNADKDLQDDEGNTAEAISVALKAVEAIGGDALKECMEMTGAGNHPAMVRAFYTIGKRMAEGSIPSSSGGPSSDQSKAAAMYRNSNHN